ncbi:MAG TPA: choice-of-anchor tandem repeat GloVer-containing protein [Rhizomicrobium sp.]|nr:choice-of-anchor tandem repeat GloVer-containing protein [Rhizomicrobium sp.]
MKSLVFGIALALGLTALDGGAHAATFSTLHTFCQGGAPCTEGAVPTSLAMDADGNLFGVTFSGGKGRNAGVIYELIPNADRSAWTYVVLYEFCRLGGCNGGTFPVGKLVVDTAGNLFGVATDGGLGHGVVFELMHNASSTQWTYNLLHRFCYQPNCADGKQPMAGLTYAGAETGALYDGISPLYGTTQNGGANDAGVVYEMRFQGAAFHERVLYSFGSQPNDGASPDAPLIMDASGNLFGVTQSGGAHEDIHSGGGTAFKLTPGAHGSWTETVLYSFNALPDHADGYAPIGGMVMDESGALYGTTIFGGGTGRQGTLFKLAFDGSAWQETVLHAFCSETSCADGTLPQDTLTLDGSGNILGVARMGGAGFRNRWTQSGAGVLFSWDGAFHDQHDFCTVHRCTDGADPSGTPLVDGAGTIFGVAAGGGDPNSIRGGAGTLYQIVP